MDRIKNFTSRHSLTINSSINIALSLLCVFSYVVIFLLYATGGLFVPSFENVDNDSTVTPTAFVPILGVLLTGATTALLTRCVEHDVWLALMKVHPGSSKAKIARIAKESSHRAQWSVSPFARFLYTFTGRSKALRAGGLLLFGTAVLNPVLLYGIRPRADQFVRSEVLVPTEDKWLGFIGQIDVGTSYDCSNIPVITYCSARSDKLTP